MDIFNDDEMIAAQIEKEHQEWLTKALASAPSSSSLPRSEEEEAKEKTDEEPVKLKTDESSPARPSTPPLLCSPSPPAEVLDERPWDEAAVRLEGVPEEKAAGVMVSGANFDLANAFANVNEEDVFPILYDQLFIFINGYYILRWLLKEF